MVNYVKYRRDREVFGKLVKSEMFLGMDWETANLINAMNGKEESEMEKYRNSDGCYDMGMSVWTEEIERGRSEGLEQGRSEGRQEERRSNIGAMVNTLLGMGTSADAILSALQGTFKLNRTQARRYLARHS